MIRLLLCEDEPRMREALEELLRQEGYETDAMGNGEKALEAIVRGSYDLAVLDVMLPGASGLEIAAAARRAGVAIPILLLTARSSVDDKVAGLDSGADDYMTKPFEPRELLARLRAMGRRLPEREGEALRFGDLSLDVKALQLSRGGKSIRLTAAEARLLETLIRRAGEVTCREHLALQAFGYEDGAEYNKVEVYLSFLRKKLNFLGSDVAVKAERGLGYRLQEGAHVP